MPQSRATTTAIVLRGLGKSYRSSVALSDVSLSVPVGSVFCLLGANGAGKSTLLRILSGLFQPTAGDVEILGLRWGASRLDLLRRIGVCLEIPAVYPRLSGCAHLRMSASLREMPPGCEETHLSRWGIPADAARRRVREYSQGMIRRLGLAISTVHNPELLILDEPTNELDPQGTEELLGVIGALCHLGTTVVLSSHRLEEVERVATHLAVLHQGTLVACGDASILWSKTVEVMTDRVPDAIQHLHSLGHPSAVQDKDGNGGVVIPDGTPTVAAAVAKALIDGGFPVYSLSCRRTVGGRMYGGLPPLPGSGGSTKP